MSISIESLLKELWPKYESDEYKSFEFELSSEDKKTISTVFIGRKCSCVLCGRSDFENFDFSFTFIKRAPLSVHAFCPCGHRVATVSRATLNKKIIPKNPISISLDEFLFQVELKR